MESGYLLDDATGAITLTFGGTSYVLPRPDFGQLREYMTLNEKRVEAETALFVTWEAEDTDEPDRTEESDQQRAARVQAEVLDGMRRESARQAALLVIRFDFWRQVSGVFGVTLPSDDDKFEPWVGNAQLCDEVVAHWIAFPFRRHSGAVAGP
jgi:hypothetical protein